MIRVHIFHTGLVKVDQAIPLHEKNPLAVTGLFRSKKKQRILPVSCYLIEHPKGNILIDTGWDTKYATKRPREWFGLVDKISGPIIQEDEGVDSKLRSVGLTASKVDAVFYSHMDFDHTSGMRLVKEAKAFYTAKEELADAKKSKFRYINTWDGYGEIKAFEYKDTGLGPVGKTFDVFKDGSVILINTPGHSHGHFAVKISGDEKYMILANDGAYVQESFDDHIIPGFTVDKRQAEQSLEWLIACKRDPDCLEVIANHDPSVKEHVVELKCKFAKK